MLQRRGLDTAAPTVWIAEGLLLGYLSAEDQDQLLGRITELSAPSSRLALDHIPDSSESIESRLRIFADSSKEQGYVIAFGSPTFLGERNNAKTFLHEHGWSTWSCNRDDLHRAAGLPAPVAGQDGPPPIEYVTAERL
jgi:O-methyltransferase involved in polyketide biosynthesis